MPQIDKNDLNNIQALLLDFATSIVRGEKPATQKLTLEVELPEAFVKTAEIIGKVSGKSYTQVLGELATKAIQDSITGFMTKKKKKKKEKKIPLQQQTQNIVNTPIVGQDMNHIYTQLQSLQQVMGQLKEMEKIVNGLNSAGIKTEDNKNSK